MIKILLIVILLSSCSLFQKKKEKIKPVKIPQTETCPFPQVDVKLHSAFFHNDINEIMTYLEENNIDPNSRTVFCATLIHKAVQKRNLTLVKLLIDYGVPFDEISSFKETPLSLAVDTGNTEIADFLIKKGARTNLIHSFDNSLFFKALRLSSDSMIDLLMKHQICPLGQGFMNTPIEKTYAEDFIKEKALIYKQNYLKTKGSCLLIQTK